MISSGITVITLPREVSHCPPNHINIKHAAAPKTNEYKALDPKLLPKILYFAEFAAAAYCDPNHVVGTQVTCAEGVCSEITANNVTTILEFAKSVFHPSPSSSLLY